MMVCEKTFENHASAHCCVFLCLHCTPKTISFPMKISPGNRDQRTSMHKDSNLHAHFEQKSRNFLSLARFLIVSDYFIIGNTDLEKQFSKGNVLFLWVVKGKELQGHQFCNNKSFCSLMFSNI